MARSFSGRRLRETRIAAGISPERLALEIERSAYSVHEYERGRVHPPLDVLCRLAGVLQCGVEDLLIEEALSGV